MYSIFGYKIYDSQYSQMKIIETDKFILRPANFNDIDDFYEYLSQEKVVKYLPFKAHKNIATTKKFVRNFFIDNYKHNKLGNYAVYYKPDKKVIGNVGFNNVSIHAKKSNLGVCINPEYWGNNFATELTLLIVIVGFEFTTLEKLVAVTYSKNSYAPKSLQILNFRYIKTCKPKNNLPISHIFELTRADYLNLKKEYLPNLIKQYS
ncbi:GNAT family N-acetyltransferase [Terrisporobacter sp.]